MAAGAAAADTAGWYGCGIACLLGDDESPRVDGDLLLRADVPVCRVFPGPYECCLLWGARGGEKRRADPPGRRDPGRRTLAGRFLCDAFGQPDGTGAIQGLRYDGYDPVGIPGQHGKAGSDGRLYRSGL